MHGCVLADAYNLMLIFASYYYAPWPWSCISLSLPKVRNFAHFFSTFKHPVRHEMLKNLHIHCCMSASTDKLRPRSLRSGLSVLGSGGRRFEEGSHLCFTFFKKKKKLSMV